MNVNIFLLSMSVLMLVLAHEDHTINNESSNQLNISNAKHPQIAYTRRAVNTKRRLSKVDLIPKHNNVLFFPKRAKEQLSKNNTNISQNVMYEVPIIDVDQNNTNNTMNFANIFSSVFRSGRKLVNGIVNKLKGQAFKSEIPDDSEGRFLNIIEIVNFNNVECFTSSGVRGICQHPFECATAGGTQSETCADGYGVCCKFQYSCGDLTYANFSTFANPAFPQANRDRLSCTLVIHKAHFNVNQLKLSFVQMELQPPTNGTCVDDQFVIAGQNINNAIPILCGINNGQHVYVEVGETPGPFYVSVLTATEASRVFQIEIKQLNSDSEDRAPTGCLQYHTAPSGELETFNYQLQSSLPSYREPGYFNNLNYAICIQRASGSCSVTYSTTSDDTWVYDFQILNYDSDGIPLIPPDQAGAEIFNCPDDFIIVNGIRLCGERLNDASITEDFTVNAPVTELNAGPINLIFRTNGNVTGRGFHLFYKQNPCAVTK